MVKDSLLFAGCVGVTLGFGLAWMPLGVVVGGAMLMVLSFAIPERKGRN